MTKKPDALPYHHGNLRMTLLTAAIAYLAQSNEETLSLRSLAAQAGVSVAAVYRHFPSKNALLAEVAIEGLHRLIAEWENGLPSREEVGAQARFQRVGEIYIAFGLNNASQFRVMFGREDLRGFPELRAAAEKCFGFVVSAARDLVEEAGAESKWILPLANAAWSMVHGYIHLSFAHLLTRSPAKADLTPAMLTRFLQLPAEALQPASGKKGKKT